MLPKSLSWHGVRFLHLLEKIIINVVIQIRILLSIALVINGLRLKRTLIQNLVLPFLLLDLQLPFLCSLMIDQQIRMGDLPTSFIQLFFHVLVHEFFRLIHHLYPSLRC